MSRLINKLESGIVKKYMSQISEKEISERLNLALDEPIYFEKKKDNRPLVYEVVNFILEPLGYEEISLGQFKRVAGGSANSSNKVKNYAEGNGAIANGFTYLKDIITYCNNSLDNSILIPLEDIIQEFKWAKKAVNENYITLYSGGKTRYDIEAMMDITKGLLNEVAFKLDCHNNGIEIGLNREFYTGTSNTDQGQDIQKIKFSDKKEFEPKVKIQVKDVQYFMLVSSDEFNGQRQAKLFIGYKIHWKKANTGQRFFRSLGGRGEELFSDYPKLEGIRAERRGWALREDFKELLADQPYKGMKFNNNNMFIYWDELKDLKELFSKMEKLIEDLNG